MSCSVECIVAIYAVPKLLAVIQAMAALSVAGANSVNDEEKIEIKHEKTLVDSVGNKIAVDLVLTNTFGDRIGVKAKPPVNGEPQPLEFIFQDASSTSAKKTIDQVRQAYARLEILNDLKSKGYKNVKEERLPNGSIRLVVQKWQ